MLDKRIGAPYTLSPADPSGPLALPEASGLPGLQCAAGCELQTGWLAVWTRAHHEKTVRDHLDALSVETFLPLLHLESRRMDRRATMDIPAFPGYLFAHLPVSDASIVKTVRGVVQVLGPTPTEYSIVPDTQIEAVRRLVESRLRVDPFPYMKVGSLVRVKSGPLKGLEGVLVKKRSGLRLVVDVDLLCQSIATEISAADVECA